MLQLNFVVKITGVKLPFNQLQTYSGFDCKTTYFTVNLPVEMKHFIVKIFNIVILFIVKLAWHPSFQLI